MVNRSGNAMESYGGALTMLEISAHHALHITHQHLKQLSEDTSWAAFSIFAKAWSVMSAGWGKFLAERLGVQDNSGYKTKTFHEHVQQFWKACTNWRNPNLDESSASCCRRTGLGVINVMHLHRRLLSFLGILSCLLFSLPLLQERNSHVDPGLENAGNTCSHAFPKFMCPGIHILGKSIFPCWVSHTCQFSPFMAKC